MGSHYTVSKGSVFCISGPEDDFTISRNILPVQYASTINIGVLDGQLLILLLMLKHFGMADSNIMIISDHLKLVQAHTDGSFTRVVNLFTNRSFKFNTTSLDPPFTLTSVLVELPHTIDALCCLFCLHRNFPFQVHFLPVLFVSWLIFCCCFSLFRFPFDLISLFLVRHILERT